ncbi:MAG TPA: hypothetical protein PKJ96_11830, partial [Thiobacillaceae bacterium]|nr:hypothetical protein [Thiobacillaceae bacterium]
MGKPGKLDRPGEVDNMLDLPRNLTWRRRRITPLPKEEPGLTELARRMHRFDLFAPLPEALC